MGGAGVVVEFGEIVVDVVGFSVEVEKGVEVEKVVEVVSFDIVVESDSVVNSVVSSVVEDNNSVVGVVSCCFVVDVTLLNVSCINSTFVVGIASFVTFAEDKIIIS
jgi:hypothetical protein